MAGIPRGRIQRGAAAHDSLTGSAWRFPLLLPPTLVALWVLRRRGGEWFSVPAVFPATQFYYVSTALPALVGRPAIAALLALPVPLLTPLVVIALAVAPWSWGGPSRRGWRIPQLKEGSAPV